MKVKAETKSQAIFAISRIGTYGLESFRPEFWGWAIGGTWGPESLTALNEFMSWYAITGKPDTISTEWVRLKRSSNKISLNPFSIVRVLGITAFLLVLASVAGSLINSLAGHNHLYGLTPLFNVDDEQNIPTFFSTFTLLFAALLLGVIAVLKRNQTDPYASS